MGKGLRYKNINGIYHIKQLSYQNNKQLKKIPDLQNCVHGRFHNFHLFPSHHGHRPFPLMGKAKHSRVDHSLLCYQSNRLLLLSSDHIRGRNPKANVPGSFHTIHFRRLVVLCSRTRHSFHGCFRFQLALRHKL